MSRSAVKISLDLLSNPLCEQDQDFLNMVTALDTAMKRMDAFNQEKVTDASWSPPPRDLSLGGVPAWSPKQGSASSSSALSPLRPVCPKS